MTSDSARCPFCDATFAKQLGAHDTSDRLGRAARMAFGAALVTVACGGTGSDMDASTDAPADTTAKDSSGGSDATADQQSMDANNADAAADAPQDTRPDNFFPPYGAPPGDGLLV